MAEPVLLEIQQREQEIFEYLRETWNRGSRASVARANRVQPSNSRRRNWWQSPLCSHYFAAAIESTWIVFVFASSVPVTVTFLAANFSGVFWSLNA